MSILDQIKELVYELKQTSSSLEKKEILKKHLADNKELQKIVHYTYNPFYQFYITSDVCEKNIHLSGKQFECIFELLDSLRLRKLTGHDAIGAVNAYIKKNEGYKEIVYTIIDKDLKTRTAEKTINSAVKNLIPEFEVALADKYDEKNVNFKDTWYASQKMDGVRFACVVDENGKATSYSRQGKIFTTLGVVEKEIESLGLKNVVFDGELCAIKNGAEDFQAIMKLIRKKDYTIPNPAYKIFDMIDIDDFFNKKSKDKLSTRLQRLKETIPDKNKCIQLLKQTIIRDKDHFSELLKEASDKSWEGLMLRRDCVYEGKRSKNLLKVKTFFDAEYKVIDIESGPFRLVVDGKEVEETMLSNVTIKHKGFPVRVGSGFSIEQRREFHKHPENILGKIVSIQYFEETKNQSGGTSLRFPTLKHLYGDKREV